MWSTLVVASLYAGVALSAPIEQTTETQNTAAQYPNWYGDSDGYQDGSWGGESSWGRGQRDRYPSAYPASQADRRPGIMSWLGFGSNRDGGSAYAPAAPSCSATSRGFLSFLPSFLGGGRSKECDSRSSRPEPWKAPGSDLAGGLGGLGGFYPSSAAFNPLAGLRPSSAAPLPAASLSPKPSPLLAPTPISSAAPVPKPSPAAPKPEPSANHDMGLHTALSSAKPTGNRVPTLGASSAKALPTSQAPAPALNMEDELDPYDSGFKPSSQAIVPAPTSQIPKPVPTSQAPKPQSSSIAKAPPAVPAPVQAPPQVVNHGLWQPQVAEPFQIILSGHPDVNVKLAPDYVNIFDLDLFNTPVSTIKMLRDQGKKVICYFSAGSSEDWRPDYKQLSKSDMGNKVAKTDSGSSFWEGERWLNIKNPNPDSPTLPAVWKIMRDRIKLAAEKGCNAVDPDNIDGYGNTNGLHLTEQDSINFMKFMAKEARGYNMSIGLKNADSILPQVQDIVQFAVNEECAANNECSVYQAFLMSKPVFHIEYTKVKSGSTTGFGYDSSSSASSEASSLSSSNSAGLLSPASSASASGALTSAAPSSWLGSLGSWGSSSTSSTAGTNSAASPSSWLGGLGSLGSWGSSSTSGTKSPSSTAGTSSGSSLSSLLGGLGSWGSSSTSSASETKAPSSSSSWLGFLNPFGKSSPSSPSSTSSTASPSSWFGSWGSSSASAPTTPSSTASSAAPKSFLGSLFTGLPKGLGAIASGVGSLFGWKKPVKAKRDTVDTTVDSETIAYNKYCTPSNAPELGPRFSTVIKVEALDGWVRFCDGRVADTRITTVDVPSHGRSKGDRGDDSSDREDDGDGKSTSFRGWNRAIRRRLS